MPEPLPSVAPIQGLFPTTHWSLVRRAGSDTSAEMQAALGDLCQAYWYPLYAYVRRRGQSVHDAQDLTQAFILELIEGPLLSRADPEKGRFRSFVLTALRHFLANEHRHEMTQRRGGHIKLFSLDESGDETRFALESAEALTAEDHFERAWAFALLEAVLTRLREEYDEAGRGPLFAALHPYLAGRRGQSRYGEIGRALAMGENTVAVSIHRMRRRYAEILREEISRTVASPGEIEDEIAHLLAVVAS